MRREKDKEQSKHVLVLEEGRKITQQNYADVEKDHTGRLDEIALKWNEFCDKCDKWHEGITTRLRKQENAHIATL